MKARIVTLVCFLALLLILGCCVSQVFAQELNYPRITGYAGNRSWGLPLTSTTAGPIDTLTARNYARHQTVRVGVPPWWPYDPRVMPLMRDYNHALKVFGYIQCGIPWEAHNPPEAFAAQYWQTLVDYDGFMYDVAGNIHEYMKVNWGNATVADTLAKLFARVGASGIFDGLFFDSIGIECAWMGRGNPLNPRFDLERAGFHSDAQMDSARLVNVARMVSYIKGVCGEQFIVTGNAVGNMVNLDGTVREGFDHGLYTFDQVMKWDRTLTTQYNVLKTETGWSGPYTADACRDVRFTLGTSCLMNHVAMTNSPDPPPEGRPYLHQWWYDEFAVEPKFHYTDTTGKYTGWLGKAVVAADSLIGGRGLWRRDFPNGFVLVNPTSQPLDHDFGMLVWQIQGIRDPQVNRGQKVRRVTVPPHDARFYMRIPRNRPPGKQSFRPLGRTPAATAAYTPPLSDDAAARAAYKAAQKTGDHYQYGSSVIVGRVLLRLAKELAECQDQH